MWASAGTLYCIREQSRLICYEELGPVFSLNDIPFTALWIEYTFFVSLCTFNEQKNIFQHVYIWMVSFFLLLTQVPWSIQHFYVTNIYEECNVNILYKPNNLMDRKIPNILPPCSLNWSIAWHKMLCICVRIRLIACACVWVRVGVCVTLDKILGRISLKLIICHQFVSSNSS